MVRPSSRPSGTRPSRASATRPRRLDPRMPGADEVDPAKYPNLAAHLQMERQRHVRAARRAGMTRKQASRHADEHLGEGAGSGE